MSLNNILTKIVVRLKQKLALLTGPVMVPGFRSADGTWRPRTRYSSSTYFAHKKKIMMGDYVFIGPFSFLDGSNGLEIGEGCQIGFWTTLVTHSSHYSIRLYGREYSGGEMIGYVKGPLKIGAYTFVGPHSVLMPNTTIGKGSIVSAFSMVQGNFPDFSIIAGNPAKVVGDTRKLDKRFLERHPELRPHYEEWAGKQMKFSGE